MGQGQPVGAVGQGVRLGTRTEGVAAGRELGAFPLADEGVPSFMYQPHSPSGRLSREQKPRWTKLCALLEVSRRGFSSHLTHHCSNPISIHSSA